MAGMPAHTLSNKREELNSSSLRPFPWLDGDVWAIKFVWIFSPIFFAVSNDSGGGDDVLLPRRDDRLGSFPIFLFFLFSQIKEGKLKKTLQDILGPIILKNLKNQSVISIIYIRIYSSLNVRPQKFIHSNWLESFIEYYRNAIHWNKLFYTKKDKLAHITHNEKRMMYVRYSTIHSTIRGTVRYKLILIEDSCYWPFSVFYLRDQKVTSEYFFKEFRLFHTKY